MTSQVIIMTNNMDTSPHGLAHLKYQDQPLAFKKVDYLFAVWHWSSQTSLCLN